MRIENTWRTSTSVASHFAQRNRLVALRCFAPCKLADVRPNAAPDYTTEILRFPSGNINCCRNVLAECVLICVIFMSLEFLFIY